MHAKPSYVIVATVLAFFATRPASAASAPPQLYGKTIALSWTASFMVRPAGVQLFSHAEHLNHLLVYVSASGRLFVRIWTQTGAGARSINEQVGTSGRTNIGGAQTAQFAGRSLVVTSAFQGGANRYQIDFDASFGTCTASIIAGKETGAGSVFQMKGPPDNTSLVEVKSETNSTPTCSIEEGNAFAK
jgi:hypothetical protein